MYKAPAPTSYWEPPMDLVTFEQQLQGTPPGLSPLDTPASINSTPPISKKIIQSSGGDQSQPGIGKSNPRDMTNNFGYIDKPGIVSAAGMLPGMLGMAGKAVNLGINANNQSAVSGARKTLGLPDQTGWETAKGIAKDNKGLVSNNVSINNKNYPVGFEATTKDNRTTLTPNEALSRANLLGGLKEVAAPQAETKASNAFSSIFDEASNALSSIFGGDIGKPTEHLDMNQGITSAERMRSFPSAPAAKGGIAAQTDPKKTAGPWGGAGNTTDHTGYGTSGTSGQSVGPSGGGNGGWGGPH